MQLAGQKQWSVLFVCLGNICRSAMAEGLAKKILGPGVRIESAGIAAYRSSAAPEAIEVMQSMGVDISGHQPRNTSNIGLGDFDIIVAMDSDVFDCLEQEYHVPTCELIKWNIEDPYGQGLEAYKKCADEIERSVQDLATTLVHKSTRV